MLFVKGAQLRGVLVKDIVEQSVYLDVARTTGTGNLDERQLFIIFHLNVYFVTRLQHKVKGTVVPVTEFQQVERRLRDRNVKFEITLFVQDSRVGEINLVAFHTAKVSHVLCVSQRVLNTTFDSHILC
jgi:hypothetical protein